MIEGAGLLGRVAEAGLLGLPQVQLAVAWRKRRERQGLILCQQAASSLAAPEPAQPTTSRRFEKNRHHELCGKPSRGSALPFGATRKDNGVNFAIHSSAATSISLCLFTLSDLQQGLVTQEIALHPRLNRTGDVWHIYVPDIIDGLLYGYHVDGPFSPENGHRFNPTSILIDPYAKAIVSREAYGVPDSNGNCWPQMGGMVPPEAEDAELSDDCVPSFVEFLKRIGAVLLSANTSAGIIVPFDWEGDVRPCLQQKDLIVYEMHVRGFTSHKSSNVKHPGTYHGLVENLNHLKELGINAIELMPCNEFNELEYYAYNSVMGDYKVNFWGYSTINFFSPMIRYAKSGNQHSGLDAINEFKTLVREAHKQGIEVFMDVVFNHTAEGNEMGPTISFRGVDNVMFYMLAPKGEFYNYSGCGNTFNCNNPMVRRFIVECLRYWVTEMHIDGFRFDLASILTRSSSLWDKENVFGSGEGLDADFLTTGTPLSEPPLIDIISNDPVLCDVKLIAEPWDCGGLYQVGKFPHWGLWSEWNGQFRDTVRQFIKGTTGVAGTFAHCLCGSPQLYKKGGRKPWHSMNFVTAHDGFSLADVVSYNKKHNIANGEGNNDGETHNNSWNCGEEGELVNQKVQLLRQRQMRNLMLALIVSQGVPMITMGDEYAHTKGGNNNTYCHDNYINYFRWDKKEADTSGFYRFTRLLLNFRRECESLGLPDFPTAERLQWHGELPNMPDWSETSRFVAFTLVDSRYKELYIAFNAGHLAKIVALPQRQGYTWQPLVDTGKPCPYDFLTEDLPDRNIAITQYTHFLKGNIYPMSAYSSIILHLMDDEI